jgi:hypothetical protein
MPDDADQSSSSRGRPSAAMRLLNSGFVLWLLGAVVSLLGVIYAAQRDCQTRASEVIRVYPRLIVELSERINKASIGNTDVLTRISQDFVFTEFKDKTFGELASDLALTESNIDVEEIGGEILDSARELKPGGPLTNLNLTQVESDQLASISDKTARELMTKAFETTQHQLELQSLIQNLKALIYERLANAQTTNLGPMCSWPNVITRFILRQHPIVHATQRASELLPEGAIRIR